MLESVPSTNPASVDESTLIRMKSDGVEIDGVDLVEAELVEV